MLKEDWFLGLDRSTQSLTAMVVSPESGVVRQLSIHFDQDYADEDVDSLRDECRRLLDARGGAGVKLVAAAEGMTLSL